MRTRLMLRPGQRGTRKLLRIHGDRLVCVRYRYDDRTGRRIKTVELIVDEAPWRRRIDDTRIVGIRIGEGETMLRLRAKGVGATYDARRRMWVMPYGDARRIEVAERAVLRGFDKGISYDRGCFRFWCRHLSSYADDASAIACFRSDAYACGCPKGA